MYKNPLARLQILGEGILQAMRSTGHLESMNCIVKTELTGIYHTIYLAGGTGHDKTLFAKCMYEFFDAIDNQRYILYKERRKRKMDGYFAIPEIFAKRKSDAEIFAQYMKSFIGKYQVIYTRNQAGRQILLPRKNTCFGKSSKSLFDKKESERGFRIVEYNDMKEMQAKIKLIAVDMDGTFLDDQMNYQRSVFRKIYEYFKKNDIHFVVASGNQYYQLKSFFDDFQDELTYISENGALIIEKQQEIFHNEISCQDVEVIVQRLQKDKRIGICLCGMKSGIYTQWKYRILSLLF